MTKTLTGYDFMVCQILNVINQMSPS